MSKESSIKTAWDLTLYYKSPNDPQIEKDYQSLEKLCVDFADRFRDFDTYKENILKLKEALEAYEKLQAAISGAKPLMYFFYRKSLDTQDIKNHQEMSKGTTRLTQAHNKTLFFQIALGKVSDANKKKYRESKELKPFHYFLEILWQESKHHLSESEEKIMNLKSLPAQSLWIDAQEKILYSHTVPFKGKQLPLAEAQFTFSALPTKDRHTLYKKLIGVYKKVAPIAEAEINAIFTDKKINDTLRGFTKPYDSTLLSFQNSEKEVMALVQAVTNAFSISHDFYALKRKILGLTTLLYADRAAKIGTVKQTFTFDQSVETVTRAFTKADPDFARIFQSFLSKGQIDVFPRKGKDGGAYCSGAFEQPTFVFLNHVNTFDSLSTLAHEMGHAIHTEYSKTQTPLYQGFTTSVAEVASTLFENFVFDEVFETLNEKEKIIALHDRLQDDIQTIFRQIACFNFEVELHESIRREGALSAEAIASLQNKNMKSYLGPHFKLSVEDGLSFASWSHIRRFFYVYSYAYGELVSKVLYRRFKEDKKYIEKIKEFLRAGGSKSPSDIFKAAGIDTSKPDFITEGLEEIKEKIKELETLAKKAKMLR